MQFIAKVLSGSSVAMLAGVGHAASFSEIEYWIGTGANEAALVIDWNDGKADESLLWGYRWDGAATGEDMLLAVLGQDGRLFGHVGPAGAYGTPLYGLGYDLDGDDDFGVTGLAEVSFDAAGLSVGAPVDGGLPSDSDDHWQAGWFTDGFWVHWTASGKSSLTWASGLGLSSQVLSDGDWAGLSFDPVFSFTDVPSEPVAAVPEPASLALLGIGGVVLMRRRSTNHSNQ